jgi:hypothetical protein
MTRTLLSKTICAVVIFSALLSTIPTTYAGGGPTGRATEATQIQNRAELRAGTIANTLTAGNTSATALATGGMFAKENLLDGIAWAIAKQMVSNITRSLINWINSGFQGSPAFVTDLDQMLLDALDQVAGEYISSLGEFGEFICSPFRLDVQAALSVNYAQARSGTPSGPSENMCTLTGIGSNIENFLSGTVDSWDQWLTVTSNPQNTPYGAYLEAEAKLNAKLVNEAGKEIELASWGDGFLSKKVCQAIEGTSREDCKITTPGQVVSEALTFQLSTGPRSLVEADEINELVGALINQLILQAVQGLNGLLGLSETGSDGQSYLDRMVNEDTGIDYSPYRREMEEAYEREVRFLTLINRTRAIAERRIASSTSDSAAMQTLVTELTTHQTQVTSNLAALSVLINRYDSAAAVAASTTASSTRTDGGSSGGSGTNSTSPRRGDGDIGVFTGSGQGASSTASTTNPVAAAANRIRQEVVLDYIALKSRNVLTTDNLINTKEVEWRRLIDPYEQGRTN